MGVCDSGLRKNVRSPYEQMSVLSRLILGKINCHLYMGVHIKWVSIERGSTTANGL